MLVRIDIRCEDEKDLMTHLSVIRQTIKTRLKQADTLETLDFEDENCYGGHSVTIKQ